MTGLSPRVRDEICFLVVYLLDDVLDDPAPEEEAREAWASVKLVCEEVGLDLHEIAREQGTTYERERLGRIVGEVIG